MEFSRKRRNEDIEHSCIQTKKINMSKNKFNFSGINSAKIGFNNINNSKFVKVNKPFNFKFDYEDKINKEINSLKKVISKLVDQINFQSNKIIMLEEKIETNKDLDNVYSMIDMLQKHNIKDEIPVKDSKPV